LEVISFDLHDPTRPIQEASIHLGGLGECGERHRPHFARRKMGANGGTAIDIVDISDPNGAMTRGGSVSVAGSVEDKFKLHEDQACILTVVSQKWRERTRQEIDDLLNPSGHRSPSGLRHGASQVGITCGEYFFPRRSRRAGGARFARSRAG
jgi:hypothetical protein